MIIYFKIQSLNLFLAYFLRLYFYTQVKNKDALFTKIYLYFMNIYFKLYKEFKI